MKAVNLLPSEHRGSAKAVPAAAATKPDKGATPFGAYIVLGLLAFAVAATALSVLGTNTIKERKSELARVTAEAEATEAKAGALQSYADFNLLASQRVATVRSLAGSRFEWQRTLDDLSKALPADVHLRSVAGTTTSGGSGLASSIAAPSIQLTGCTSTQDSVARLMSRLRNVRGVTRVALSASQKVAQSAIPAAAGESSLCADGTPPDFDLTMFFERAALPAGAVVNTAASGNSTTATTASGTAPAAAATAATPTAGAAATATPAATVSATTPTSSTGAAK